MKTFFGGTFIDKEKLEEAGIDHPIKLEYYKQINEDYRNSYGKAKYGIQIVETEYLPDDPRIETKNIECITNNEMVENKILKIFKENQVTVINSEEIISDLFKNIFIN